MFLENLDKRGSKLFHTCISLSKHPFFHRSFENKYFIVSNIRVSWKNKEEEKKKKSRYTFKGKEEARMGIRNDRKDWYFASSCVGFVHSFVENCLFYEDVSNYHDARVPLNCNPWMRAIPGKVSHLDIVPRFIAGRILEPVLVASTKTPEYRSRIKR